MPASPRGASQCCVNAAARCRARIARHRPTPGDNPMPDQTQAMMSQRSRLRARYDNFIGGKWQAPVKGRYFTDPSPVDGIETVRRGALGRRGCRTRAGRRACRARRLGPHRAGRTRAHAEQDRRPDRGKSRTARLCRDGGQRQADPRDAATPTCRWRRIISATSPAASAPRKARWRNSTTTPSPITSASRWAWSRRSFRGTSRC